jgi:hypothetical protein
MGNGVLEFQIFGVLKDILGVIGRHDAAPIFVN